MKPSVQLEFRIASGSTYRKIEEIARDTPAAFLKSELTCINGVENSDAYLFS